MDFKQIIDKLESVNRRSLDEYLNFISKREIYIYGAGCFGRELAALFNEHDISWTGFIDRNAPNCKNLEKKAFLPPNVLNKGEITVVIGIVMNKADRLKLISDLNAMGYKNIIDGQSIRAHYVYALEGDGEKNPKEYFSRRLDDIEKAKSLFFDEESVSTYEGALKAHILRDYSNCPQTEEIHQYFAENIPFKRGFSRFVDCGAYIGDTLGELCALKDEVEAVVAFEPNSDNFSRLALKCKSLKDKIPEAYLFPCGANDKTEVKRFTMAGGSSSLGEAGETLVQCVAMDEAISDFKPTFIKMDIEGAEYNAILGAKEIITKYRPDLAISVYHIIDDFWRIALLIDSFKLNYRFYLRTHSSGCMETVLYAVHD